MRAAALALVFSCAAGAAFAGGYYDAGPDLRPAMAPRGDRCGRDCAQPDQALVAYASPPDPYRPAPSAANGRAEPQPAAIGPAQPTGPGEPQAGGVGAAEGDNSPILYIWDFDAGGRGRARP